MKSISKLFLFIGFCLCINLHSQEYKNLDSLITKYKNHVIDTAKVTLGSLIYQNLSFTNPEESYKYAHEMVNISEQINYETGIALGYNNLSFYFLNKDRLDSALYYKKASLDIVTRLQNIGGILTVNMGLAVLYNKKNDFNKAEEYLNSNIAIFENRDTIKNAREIDFKYIGSTYHALANIDIRRGLNNLALKNELRSLELYKERAKDPLFEADSYFVLGQTEMDLQNYKQSFVYLEQALKVYTDFKDLLWESDVLKVIGENLILQNKPEEALKYLLRCIKIANENQFQLTEAIAYTMLGNAYSELNRNSEALQSLHKSVEIYGKMENPTEINKTYTSLGIFYNKLNQPKSALTYFKKAIVISDSIGAIPQVSEAYFHRSQSFQKLNEYERALEDFKLYSSLKDSIFTIKKSQQIEEMRTIHETEKKEVEIALQQKEINTLNEKARADRLKKGLYSGGMVSVLALSGLLVFGFRQRIKKNKIAREKQEEIYKQEIAHKKKELTSQTLHLVQKNTFIQELMENLENVKNSPDKFKTEFRRIVMLLKKENASDKDWEVFKTYFSEVHNDFDQKLKTLCSDISEKEIRLSAFLRMNLTTKEIAAILNVQPDSILKSKYRLKKKLNLDKDTDLTSFLNTI